MAGCGRRQDLTFPIVLATGLKLLGERFKAPWEPCEGLVKLYKECVMMELSSSCSLYLKERPEYCPEFDKGEFKRNLRSSSSMGTGLLLKGMQNKWLTL